MADTVERVVEVIRNGGLAVIPTDTVYGLACTASAAEPASRLYALKGRTEIQPTAVLLGSVASLLDLLPEVEGRHRRVVEALLPGPWTLVLPNPVRRFPWLNRLRPDAVGVRVPALEGEGRRVLEAAVAVVATSANLPGGPDPRSLAEVPAALLAGVGAVLDTGTLPGLPSTVVDLTGSAPRVLREGAVAAEEALARIALVWEGAALTESLPPGDEGLTGGT